VDLQPDGLGDAQAARIQQLEERPVTLRAASAGNRRGDLLAFGTTSSSPFDCGPVLGSLTRAVMPYSAAKSRVKFPPGWLS